jgi:hypothetical protein
MGALLSCMREAWSKNSIVSSITVARMDLKLDQSGRMPAQIHCSTSCWSQVHELPAIVVLMETLLTAHSCLVLVMP